MAERVRPPGVAGSFYPAEAQELRQVMRDCFVSSPLGPLGGKSSSPSLLGGIVPHAGFVYSGPCAAHFYSIVRPETTDVTLIGVNHRGRGARAGLSPADSWETPMGKIRVDPELNGWLKGRVGFLEEDELSHLHEHSIEVHLPFLQTVLNSFTLLPVSLYYLSDEECAQLGEALAELYKKQVDHGRNPALIASTDLSHYRSPQETERLDRIALEHVLNLDSTGLLERVRGEKISMCGVIPTAVLLFAASALGARQARLLKHYHSGQIARMDQVVGYASVAVEFV